MRDLKLAFQVRLIEEVGDYGKEACMTWLSLRDKRELDELHVHLLAEKHIYDTTGADYSEAGADCINWMADHGANTRVWEVLYPIKRTS